ncbi:hypothetical protein [Acinetobacter sp. HY1485]|uniref:hypothetical protein n=1 Tax=Acinetobacter sp. HY1485 TaxID=2970918 RepID=UPI0022B95AB5|nr:hypothetical protein [Acinetobacter sp. HY1485]
MNAPRQGLFASLLIVSFALQTVLLVIATTHQLQENRTNQGQLMTSQLVTDSLHEMEPANTVSLALLTNRYATNPSVASIRILSATNQVLSQSGMEQTRTGDVFTRDALQNDRKVGRVEITLIKPSLGEILRTEWLAIFASLILHALLWLAYRAIARPSRSEYLARLQHDASLHAKIQELTDALEQEKQASVLAVNEAQQPQPKQLTKPTFVPNEHSIALNIQFYDPKQLLSSVSQSVAVPYFNLCQLFLEKSIELCSAHYRIDSSLIEQLGTFDQNGITLSVDAKNPNVAECLIMIGNVFQVLSEVLYKRYREEKRFVLQTRCATANMVEDMQLDAVQAATRLAQSLSAKESALYLNATLLKKLSDHYKLINFPNPSNLLTRHAYIISGMSEAYVERVEAFRTDILKGKKPKQNTFK